MFVPNGKKGPQKSSKQSLYIR